MGWCGAASPFVWRAIGAPASDGSNDGQNASAMTVMITIISTLATRVAFHATPGRIVSMLALNGSSFRHLAVIWP
jgi:hypothetical protein